MMNSDGSGMFQGTKCGSCGGRVGHRTPEKIREQDQDKGYGICEKCEEGISICEEKVWDSWRKAVRDSLSNKNQKEWDKVEVEIQKAFILQQLDTGTLKIGVSR